MDADKYYGERTHTHGAGTRKGPLNGQCLVDDVDGKGVRQLGEGGGRRGGGEVGRVSSSSSAGLVLEHVLEHGQSGEVDWLG